MKQKFDFIIKLEKRDWIYHVVVSLISAIIGVVFLILTSQSVIFPYFEQGYSKTVQHTLIGLSNIEEYSDEYVIMSTQDPYISFQTDVFTGRAIRIIFDKEVKIDGNAQLFWASGSPTFKEGASVKIEVEENAKAVEFYADLVGVDYIRFDINLPEGTTFSIQSIDVDQKEILWIDVFMNIYLVLFFIIAFVVLYLLRIVDIRLNQGRIFSKTNIKVILVTIKNRLIDIYRKVKMIKWKKLSVFIVANSVLCFILCLVKYGFSWRNIAFVFVTVCVLSMLVVYREQLIKRIEIMVFCIIMLIGSLYATSLPVSCGVSWDDETHFKNAVVMSHFFDGRISVADREILDKFVSTALEHDIYTEDTHEAWVEKINAADATGEWEFVERMTPTIDLWCYLPSALGLFIGRVLSLPYSANFIMGRWFNLLAYALLVYFSMKKLKSGKMILATVAMLPTCIFMAASYARDPWMIGFIMLGFSMIVGVIQDAERRLELKDLVAIILCFVLGISPKAIYAPIILIALCIPKEKFASQKQYKYFMIAILLALILLLATFVLPFITSSGTSVQDDRGGSDVNAGLQTAYILSQPFTYAKILLNFFPTYFSMESGSLYFTAMHYFGNAGNSILLQILLAVVIFTDHAKDEVLLKWPMKFMTLFMSFGALCLAATAMYIAFTPAYYDTILGCQTRYMLQILFPTVFVLGNVGIENKMNQKIYRGAILVVLSYVLLNAIWTLMLSTY